MCLASYKLSAVPLVCFPCYCSLGGGGGGGVFQEAQGWQGRHRTMAPPQRTWRKRQASPGCGPATRAQASPRDLTSYPPSSAASSAVSLSCSPAFGLRVAGSFLTWPAPSSRGRLPHSLRAGTGSLSHQVSLTPHISLFLRGFQHSGPEMTLLVSFLINPSHRASSLKGLIPAPRCHLVPSTVGPCLVHDGMPVAIWKGKSAGVEVGWAWLGPERQTGRW